MQTPAARHSGLLDAQFELERRSEWSRLLTFPIVTRECTTAKLGVLGQQISMAGCFALNLGG